MATSPASRVALSDADVPDGTPIRVDAWDGAYARIVYPGLLSSGSPGFHHVLVSRERAIDLLRASKRNREQHTDFCHRLSRTRALSHKAWRGARLRTVHQGRSRAARPAARRSRGSRRSGSRSGDPGSSGDPDSAEPPGLAARGA